MPNETTVNILKRVEELERLLRLAAEFSPFNGTEALQAVLQLAIEMVGGDTGSIMVMDPKTEKMRIRAAIGLSSQDVQSKNKTGIPLTEGVAGHVFNTQIPRILIGQEDPQLGQLMAEKNVSTAICVPIVEKGRCLGVLNLNSLQPGKVFTDSDLQAAQTVARGIYLAICRQLEEGMVQRACIILNRTGGGREGITWALREAQRSLGVRRMALFMVDTDEAGENQMLRGVFCTKRDEFRSVNLPITDTLAGRSLFVRAVMTQKTEVFAPNGEDSPFTAAEREKFGLYEAFQTKPCAAIPLIVDDEGRKKVIGVIVVGSETGQEVSKKEVALMETFAMIAAMVIERTNSIRQLTDAYHRLLKVLAETIEKRHPYTRGHSQRVTVIALALGKVLGLPAEELELIKDAGELHDIGKVVLGEGILDKSGPLNDSEWAELRRHPRNGADLIDALGTPRAARIARFILTHHLDAPVRGGYPADFQEELTLAEKIIRVADAFDAMVSARAYRKSLSLPTALPLLDTVFEMIRCSNRQFEVEVVKALITTLKKGLTVTEDGEEKTIILTAEDQTMLKERLSESGYVSADSRDRNQVELDTAATFIAFLV